MNEVKCNHGFHTALHKGFNVQGNRYEDVWCRVILSSPRKTETRSCLIADENNLGGSQLIMLKSGDPSQR